MSNLWASGYRHAFRDGPSTPQGGLFVKSPDQLTLTFLAFLTRLQPASYDSTVLHMHFQGSTRQTVMHIQTVLRPVESLLHTLPFQLDDYPAVNEAYRRARRGDSRAEHVVNTWAYCYVFRYLAYRFLTHKDRPLSDFDALLTKTYFKIVSHRSTVRDDTRFTIWVRVVCRNLFINYLRRPREYVGVEEEVHCAPHSPRAEGDLDAGLIVETLEAAVADLPEYLKEVASLRYLQQLSYEEIILATGKPASLVRSYAHKALLRLRKNPDLKSFYDCLRST
jgi:RNA polymerase sigma-70 factor, ECF subfamily